MARKILFDISQIKSDRLKGIMDSVDAESRKKYRDGKIDEKEAKKLRELLSGRTGLVEQESDDIKEILGFSKTVKAKGTESVSTYSTQTVTDPTTAAATKSAEQNKTPYGEVLEAFNNARGYNPETNIYAKTIDEAYQAVKNNKAFKDDKYKDALEQLRKNRKHSIADAEAQEVKRKASLSVDDRGNIVNEAALKYQDEDDVRDAQIAYIKKQNGGKIDKRVKKALRNKNQSALKNVGLAVSGNYSAGKQDDISIAHLNKAAAIRAKKYDKKGVLEIVGSEAALNNFIKLKLITEANGVYDISRLSILYRNSIGANATINEHDEEVGSEIDAFQTNITRRAYREGVTDFYGDNLTKKDILKLGDKLGYYDDHYHGKFVRTWQRATAGLAQGAIIGAAAGTAMGETNLDVNNNTKVQVTFDSFSEEQRATLINGLKTNTNLSGVPVTEVTKDGLAKTTIGKLSDNSLGILITIDQLVSGTVVDLWENIGLGAAVGALAGTGFGILEGLRSKGREIECFGLTMDCEYTKEELETVIDHKASLSEAEKNGLKNLLVLGYKIEHVKSEKTGKYYDRFVMVKDEETGECKPLWDPCTFMENYNKERGNYIFNANESRMSAMTIKNRQPIVEEDCPPVTQTQVVTPDLECTNCKENPDTKPTRIPPHAWDREGGETWENIVKAKYPCLVEELTNAGVGMYDGIVNRKQNGIIRTVQRELATDENGTFHADQFKGITRGDIPAHLEFPDEIVIDVNGKKITCKYEDNPVEKRSQRELNRGGSSRRNNGRYGYGRKGLEHTYSNSCYPKIEGVGSTPAKAKANFEEKVREAQNKK